MTISLMEQEACEASDILKKQFSANVELLQALVDHIHHVQPTNAMTIARGSSDHAATFAKYLLEARAGIMTASAAPSVFTLYQKKLFVKNCLVLGISQSGASPDIAEMMSSMRSQGAITVAFVNEIDSALANAAEYVVPLHAGPEKAVAATKSYLASLGALIHFTALFTKDQELLKALSQLPEKLQEAAKEDWSGAIKEYRNTHNTLIVGRGFSFPIAQEAALKFKETAKIHAEAFSSAELLHGPFALIEEHFPILFFAQQDESSQGIQEVIKRIQQINARVMLVSPKRMDFPGLIQLNMPTALHPVCDPLMMIQAFYVMMARLSLARGLNPDAPKHLTKVTKTW